MEKNLTEGSVPKRLLGFSLPYLLSYFLQTLYGMADLLIIGRSGLSFLHNIITIGVMRVPGVYLMSQRFPDTLLPMGLATAAGSLVSVIICIIAYMCIRRSDRRSTNESYAGK